MREIVISLILVSCVSLSFSCKKTENKPFGAEDIDYEKIEVINKNGPEHVASYPENVPPIADKTISEAGPERDLSNDALMPPMADMDTVPDYGGVPILVPEHKD